MNSKFLIAIVVVAGTLSVLMYSAVSSTAKSVVTVKELVTEGSERSSVRLGARVAEDEICYLSQPTRQVHFKVRDITDAASEIIPVVYEGNIPDTLKNGRDVILEGDYDGTTFAASSLMTQCPSKYEPPVPGAAKNSTEQTYSYSE